MVFSVTTLAKTLLKQPHPTYIREKGWADGGYKNLTSGENRPYIYIYLFMFMYLLGPGQTLVHSGFHEGSCLGPVVK